jgi:hypothetical protein
MLQWLCWQQSLFFFNAGGLMNRLASLTLVALLAFAGAAAAGNMQVEQNPASFSSVTPFNGDLVLAMWDIQFSFDLEAATGALGNAGAEFDDMYYYSTRWASNLIHQLDLTGTLVKEFSIPGVSGLRDLAYDGEYWYGGAASSTIWQMDFISETLISTITGSFASRAIAYDEDEDQFICSNWADPVYVVNRDGSIDHTFNMLTTTSKYGFAYETACSGDPTLWVFDQTLGGAVIYQWDLTSGAFTGVTHDVAADFPASVGIAGGLWFTANGVEPGTATLGALLQGTPDVMVAYELCGGTEPDLEISITPVNGTNFQPGEVIQYAVAVTNNTDATIHVTARSYASNNSDWQLLLFGPVNFNLPANTTIGPVTLSNQVPNNAPPLTAYICAEANDIHDCYQVTVGMECPSVVGQWLLYYDWDCDGSYGTVTLTFFEDGTFQSSGGSNGTWTQDGCDVEWYYTNGTHYWGVMEPEGLYMEGDMLSYSGSDGCWWADRTAAKALPPVGEQNFSASGDLLE